MKTRPLRTAAAAWALCAAGLLLTPGAAPQAATLRWTGLSSSALWSDADNWDARQAPANGDALVFSGLPAQTSSVLDLSLSFASLVFAANAQAFALHVQGSGATLAFEGTGILNLTSGSGPIRQDLYADAGSAGGSIVFGASSGLNLDTAASLRPVNLTARGAAGATELGGHIVFKDNAATSGSTFDQLRAEGAAAAGGSGGDISFRGSALATQTARVTVTGGTAAGAPGALASFSELARADALFNVLAGQGGMGARVDFSGRAAASLFASFSNQGALAAGAGGQAITTFRGDSTLAGGANNEAGSAAGALGGQIEFRERASHDTAAVPTSMGMVQLRNAGAVVAGAAGGSTVFRDDAFVRGTQLLIVNAVQSEGAEAGSAGGSTEFLDRTRAGQAGIVNEGASIGAAVAGWTSFRGQASAESASITSRGGQAAGASGGGLRFADDASAGTAHIVNGGGTVAGAQGGSTLFSGNASAASAFIVNEASFSSGGGGGTTSFDDFATAGNATLDLRAAGVAGAAGGQVVFISRSVAGNAKFALAGAALGSVLGPEAARVSFGGTASAGDASFSVGGNLVSGSGSGQVVFSGGSTAARASFTLLAGQSRGGWLRFEGTSATQRAGAGEAVIQNKGSSSGDPRGLAIGGQTSFGANSSAGRATISNAAGFASGFTDFNFNAVAGAARITNLGGAAGEDGGYTRFGGTSNAEQAVIVNQAGARGTSGFDAMGVTRFVDQASAGQAYIVAAGGTAAGTLGGQVSFGDNARPDRATLVAEGGSHIGTGGRIFFTQLTNASLARVVLGAGTGIGAAGELDISGLTVGGVPIGGLDGGGTVSLGSKKLVLWAGTAGSVFSGLLRDGGIAGGAGGSLDVRERASLTLTGANTYSGGTRIGDGLTPASGKLVVANTSGSATGSGAVVVELGGTLAGSGFIAGPVTLRSGGAIVPGDPVTLSLRDSLTWDGGGVIRLALGADDAGSDHLVVHSLLRGADGDYHFELVDFGYTAGASYELLSFDSIVGFSASDFSVSGVAGSFALNGGRLEFTAAAVPEPAAALLWLLGLPALWAAARRPLKARAPARAQPPGRSARGAAPRSHCDR